MSLPQSCGEHYCNLKLGLIKEIPISSGDIFQRTSCEGLGGNQH